MSQSKQTRFNKWSEKLWFLIHKKQIEKYFENRTQLLKMKRDVFQKNLEILLEVAEQSADETIRTQAAKVRKSSKRVAEVFKEHAFEVYMSIDKRNFSYGECMEYAVTFSQWSTMFSYLYYIYFRTAEEEGELHRDVCSEKKVFSLKMEEVISKIFDFSDGTISELGRFLNTFNITFKEGGKE